MTDIVQIVPFEHKGLFHAKLIWVCAPSEHGKTTVVSRLLKKRYQDCQVYVINAKETEYPKAEHITDSHLGYVYKYAKRHGKTCLILENLDLESPKYFKEGLLDILIDNHINLDLTIIFTTQFPKSFYDFMQAKMDETYMNIVNIKNQLSDLDVPEHLFEQVDSKYKFIGKIWNVF